jgi:hypothetical protein
MRRFTSVGHLSAILFWALSNAWANAEPTHWSYSSAAFPDTAGLTGTTAGDTAIGQGMRLNGIDGGPVVGSARVRLLNLQTFNDHALRDGPSFNDVPYTIMMQLFKDGQHGDLMFSGLLSGAVHYPSQTSTVTSTFLAPISQSILRGHDRFTVTLAPFPPLQWVPYAHPPSSELLAPGYFGGTIDAQVDVTPAGVANSPEPSTLALAGLGVGLAASVTWRKRRRVAAEQHE